MFTDAQGRKWRHRIIKPDGTIQYTNDGGPLSDGHRMHVGMMMSDAARGGGLMMTDTKVNDAYLADARQKFEDAYGPGGGCLLTFSERAKALHLIGDAESGEVFRVEQAMQGLRSMAFRCTMAASNGGSSGLMRDSAEDSLLAAAFLTRMADRAHGRADALRAGQRPGSPDRFDARQTQRIADARAQGGDRAAAYEIHKAQLSNAWMRNR